VLLLAAVAEVELARELREEAEEEGKSEDMLWFIVI